MVNMKSHFIGHILTTLLASILISNHYFLSKFFCHEFSLVLAMPLLKCTFIINHFKFFIAIFQICITA